MISTRNNGTENAHMNLLAGDRDYFVIGCNAAKGNTLVLCGRDLNKPITRLAVWLDVDGEHYFWDEQTFTHTLVFSTNSGSKDPVFVLTDNQRTLICDSTECDYTLHVIAFATPEQLGSTTYATPVSVHLKFKSQEGDLTLAAAAVIQNLGIANMWCDEFNSLLAQELNPLAPTQPESTPTSPYAEKLSSPPHHGTSPSSSRPIVEDMPVHFVERTDNRYGFNRFMA